MYTLQDFAERYKMISNSELLEILQNPAQYQSIALSAAKSEFTSRNLSENEINEAKKYLLDKKNEKDKRNEKQEQIKTKLADAGNVFYDTINPIHASTSTAVKIVRLVTLVFTSLLIYKISVNFYVLLAIVKGNSGESFGYTLYFFPILVQLAATLFFWLRKRTGWLLLTFFCSYSLTEVLYGLYYSIALQFRKEGLSYLFPTPSPGAYIIAILFYIGTIFAICRHDIRGIYKIDKQKIQVPLIIGALSGIFLLMLLAY
jgi:hypothetical protein